MKIFEGARKGNGSFGQVEVHCGEYHGSLFGTSLHDKMAMTAHKLKSVTGTDVTFTNEVEKRFDTTFPFKKKKKFEMARMDIRPSLDETANKIKVDRCDVGDLIEITYLLATCAERLMRRKKNDEHSGSGTQSSNIDLEPI